MTQLILHNCKKHTHNIETKIKKNCPKTHTHTNKKMSQKIHTQNKKMSQNTGTFFYVIIK